MTFLGGVIGNNAIPQLIAADLKFKCFKAACNYLQAAFVFEAAE